VTGLVPSCIWRISPELVLALDERFGEPVDTYVNGSQVWLREDGQLVLEWRLHPVAGFVRPAGTAPHDLLERVVYALRTGEAPPAAIDALWEGLEAFPAYDDEVEPAPLAALCADVLGIPPAAYGLVDHASIGDDWERADGKVSIVASLLRQLEK